MAFYNDAILDSKEFIVLKEPKTNKYPKLGLAYKCYKSLQDRYLFQYAATKASLKAQLHNIKLPIGVFLVQL